MLSLNATETRYTPVPFPITDYLIPLIAPFWADADTSVSGHVYYTKRPTINQTLLDRATAIINTAFTGTNFVTKHLYIVTWFEVGYYGQTENSKVIHLEYVVCDILLLCIANTWIHPQTNFNNNITIVLDLFRTAAILPPCCQKKTHAE